MRIHRLALLLILITVLTYLSSFFNRFVWDDEQFIYSNAYVKSFAIKEIFIQSTTAGAGVVSNYYRPLTTLSFAIDTAVWGLHELPFHLVNTLLHSGASVLIFLILLSLSKSKKIAFVTALIFSIHPIQTEAVTYINSRGDSQYAFFGLLSLYFFVLLLERTQLSFSLYNLELKFSKALKIFLVTLFYILSVLSKEIGIVIVGLQTLIFTFYILQKREKISFVTAKKYHAAAIAIAISAIAAGTYLLFRGTLLNFDNSFNFEGHPTEYSNSVIVRLLTFTKVIFIYFKLLLLPFPLHMERTTAIVTSIFSFWPTLTFLLFVIITVLIYKEYSSKKTFFIFFGAAWFLICLLPVSGIVPINGILYEHWLYLPMVGFFITLIGAISCIFPKKIMEPTNKIFWIMVVVACLYFIPLTIRQNYFWSTPIRLYEYLLRYTASERIHNNLGMAYADEKHYEQAIAQYKKALEMSNNTVVPSLHNLANVYRDMGDTTNAILYYKKAIETDPHFYYSYPQLIKLYVVTNQLNEALTVAEKGEALFPYDYTYILLQLEITKEQKNTNNAKIIYDRILLKYSNNPNIINVAKNIYAK